MGMPTQGITQEQMKTLMARNMMNRGNAFPGALKKNHFNLQDN